MMIVKDENNSTDAMAIIQKYEEFVSYFYPIIQTCPRKHGEFRKVVLRVLFEPIRGLYRASKSKQPSRLHDVDGDFATLRSHLRFLTNDLKVMTPHQHRTALALLAHPGRMLGSWLGKFKGQAGK